MKKFYVGYGCFYKKYSNKVEENNFTSQWLSLLTCVYVQIFLRGHCYKGTPYAWKHVFIHTSGDLSVLYRNLSSIELCKFCKAFREVNFLSFYILWKAKSLTVNNDYLDFITMECLY